MPNPRSRAHHELAQQLDLARRERGLSTRELAEALSCEPRSVRRYLSGDRRPDRALVAAWERTCDAEPGSLTSFHDRASGSEAAGAAQAEPERRRRAVRPKHVAFAAVVATAGAAIALVLSTGSQGDDAAITREAASRSDISHHFARDYTGPVWFRVVPTRAHTREDHRVRLSWGAKRDAFTLKALGSGRALTLQKTGLDDTPVFVRVDPPATVEFGEGAPPAGDAGPIPSNWTSKSG